MVKKWVPTENEKEKILSMYANGVSLRKMEGEVGIGRKTLSKFLKSEDVTIRTSKETSRKFFCNSSFFDVIDTEEKAYWLGFMYADGSVMKRKDSYITQVTLSQKDRAHLEKLKKALEYTGEIKDYRGSGYTSESLFSRLLITDDSLGLGLIKNGCLLNKTNLLKRPVLSSELISHFIRGYFDGDGSAYYIKQGNSLGFNVLGTKDIIEFIAENIPVENISIRKESRSEHVYYITVGGVGKPIKIYNYLYNNANIFLDRKKEIVDNFRK